MAWVTTITAITRIAYPQNALPWGAIERPVDGQSFYGDTIPMHGWALEADGPPAAIEFRSDGTVLGRVVPTIERGDLATFGVADAPTAGFDATVTFPDRPDIKVWGIGKRGAEFPLGTVHYTRAWREVAGSPLVSVVLPCYNQAHFLSESIESIRNQTYKNVEIIVANDGSSDDTIEVAARLGVPCITQEQMGPAEARNTGLRTSTGEFVTFVDADNILLPHALETNLFGFEDRPECVLVAGRYRLMDVQGRLRPDDPGPGTSRVSINHYAELLRLNYIGSPDNAMFRRAVFEEVGGFDSSVNGTEDYDLYLRVAARYPIYWHGLPLSGSRLHPGQYSRNYEMMLTSVLEVMRRRRAEIGNDPELNRALQDGMTGWRSWFGRALAVQLHDAIRAGRWSEAGRKARALLRMYPRGLIEAVRRPSLPPSMIP